MTIARAPGDTAPGCANEQTNARGSAILNRVKFDPRQVENLFCA
jgi:hypothetical protein